ncbi:MAG: M48 family metalloprotease [Burkholderiaceae bacterium]
MFADRLRALGFKRAVLLVAIALTVGGAPAPACLAQAPGPVLPSLGDAAGDTLSPLQERRVGERIMGELRRSGVLLDDPELTHALNRFAHRIADAVPTGGQDFEFFLVRDASLNAFALPGGFVGVHSGLMIGAQTESELASVIAHEIGHVTQRHIARMLAQNRQSSLISLAAVVAAIVAAGASDTQAAAGLVALGGSVHEQQMLAFSREAEREADRVGLELMREAGFEAQDMISFFAHAACDANLRERRTVGSAYPPADQRATGRHSQPARRHGAEHAVRIGSRFSVDARQAGCVRGP